MMSSAQKRGRKKIGDANLSPLGSATKTVHRGKQAPIARWVSSPDGKQRSQSYSLFERRCESLRQQKFEKLNTAFKGWSQQMQQQMNDGTSSTVSKDGAPKFFHQAVLEYERCAGLIRHKYAPEMGDVYVWGSSDCGQLGNVDENAKTSRPCRLQNLSHKGVTKVAAGGIHNVFSTLDGCVYTCGCNDEGQLGREAKEDYDQKFPYPVKNCIPSKHQLYKGDADKIVGNNEDESIVDVKAGDSHTLLLSITGRLYFAGCYKSSEGKNIRDPRPPDDNTVDPPRGEDDDGNPCVVDKGVKGRHFNPTHVYLMPGRVHEIACGYVINAALVEKEGYGEEFELLTWGLGEHGEMGRPVEMPPKHDPNFEKLLIENMLTPKPVLWAGPTIKRQVLGMACGGFHMLVLVRENGSSDVRVYSSGLNQYGQLGHGDEKERQELTPIKALDGKNIFKVGGGEHFSFALDMTGYELYTWGRADYSQIGIHDEMPKEGSMYCLPQLVQFPAEDAPVRITNVVAGDRHNLATSERGDVYTWGYGTEEQLGHGIAKDEHRPRKIRAKTMWNKETGKHMGIVRQLAGGGQHSVAIMTLVEE
mmetsp:Transcript_7217/g.10989  ORF Transcript_7217/g.10989 Transcript_7217/m.10989 type:complete len:588 (+) Transcript_7217:266-2029(+)